MARYNMTGLPLLTHEPMRHPGCCLSLSKPLLATIGTLLDSIPHLDNNKSHDGHKPEPALVLSIGSGTGLLEELLHIYLNNDDHVSINSNSAKNWRVEGVEVDPAVNIYLPEDRINHVLGTWAVLETRAHEATVLMFVYPRDGALVRRYIDTFMTSSRPPGDKHSESKKCREDKSESGSASNKGATYEDHSEDGDEVRRNPRKGVRLVIWLGPKCDWDDTGLRSVHTSSEFELLEMRHGVGLAEYEMLAILKQKTTPM
ncbi:hypothetical protein FHL15_008515 [Xylaria flabelliformis]|uniref:Uncharacterized protein n=1 Tax=Xylaria flabelliformis TaxID=2512241 RepID=A0A553HRG5_9PEZI|nr:hypothetical protein FHL15_008515 [Xylaria flabelliformis]